MLLNKNREDICFQTLLLIFNEALVGTLQGKKTFARPRRALSYLRRVDFQTLVPQDEKSLLKKKRFFLLRSEFPSISGLCKLRSLSFGFFSRQLTHFRLCFPRKSGSVVWVKTGIHIPYMEMTTSFETRLH